MRVLHMVDVHLALQDDLSPLTDDARSAAEVDDAAVADLIDELDLPEFAT